MKVPCVESTEKKIESWFAFSHGFDSKSALFFEAQKELDRIWESAEISSIKVLEELWHRFSPDRSPRFLMELIKHDQLQRIKRGIVIDVGDYLNALEILTEDRSRVVSLAYSEYCLRHELGERVTVDEFCHKYEKWAASLRQQLDLHKFLSIPSNELAFHDQARHFPRIGETVEQFELERELGRGGSARVFLARDLRLGRRPVALKISGDRSTEPEILARLEHDNIVPVLSVHDAPHGLRLICMPYRGEMTLDRLFAKLFLAGGSNLRKAADFHRAVRGSDQTEDDSSQFFDGPEGGWRDFPLHGTFEDALAWIGWKLAMALSHAHGQQIFHRDIKPANILISIKSGPQILDFNMACDPHALAHVEDRIRGGTLPYMAPEQLGAFIDSSLWSEIGPKSDIFSLGLVLKELAVGQRVDLPLSFKTPLLDQIRLLLRIRDKPWSSLRTANPRISGAFDAILEKSLSFSPSDRYSCAADLADDFHRLIRRKPLKWATNRSRTQRYWLNLRPFRKIAILLAVFTAYWVLWPVGPDLVIDGVSAQEIQSLRAGHFAEAWQLFKNTQTENASTTHELLKFVAWATAEPENPQAQELMKSLVPKADLDNAIVQARAVLGQNRHLDFIPLFRDYCQVANRWTQTGQPVSDLEWQGLERRFIVLQKQWPEDMRLAGFLAYFASMRSDFKTALSQVEKGLKIASDAQLRLDDPAVVDLLKRRVQYSQLEAASLQSHDQPAASLHEYLRTLEYLKDFRKSFSQNQPDPELRSFLDELEIVVILGIGDVQTDLNQLEEAILKFHEARNLIHQNESDIMNAESLSRLRDQVEIRLKTLENVISNGLIEKKEL